MGRKKQPHYRIVVADSASPRDGRFVETLGYYKPLSHPARLVVDVERVDYWIEKGAQTSGTVKSLVNKARRGGDAKVALGEVDKEAQKAKRAEALAARRAAEKKAAGGAATEAAAEEEAAGGPAATAADGDAEPAAESEAGADEAAEGGPEASAAEEQPPQADGEADESEAAEQGEGKPE